MIDYDGGSMYPSTITQILDGGEIAFDWDDGSGSDQRQGYDVYSEKDQNCPTTFTTATCSATTAVYAAYNGGSTYPATVVSNDGATIKVSWDDGGNQDTPIKDVFKCPGDVCVPCVDYCRCAVHAGTIGDPFTNFNGVRTQFWPPVGVRVKLLEVDGVQLSATSDDYSNSESMLWFSQFVLSKDKKDIVRMVAADPKPLMAQKALAADSQALRTLDLSILGAGRWQNITNEGSYATADGSISLVFLHTAKKFGTGYQQAVKIQSREMNVTILSAKANKFHDPLKQLSNLHLDMKVTQIDLMKVIGVLPEIWGLKPMTAEVKDMLRTPRKPVVI